MLKQKYNRLGAVSEELAGYQEELESHRSILLEAPCYIDGQWVGDYEASYDASVYDEVYGITYRAYIQHIEDIMDTIGFKMAELENTIDEYEAAVRTETRRLMNIIKG